MTLGRKGSRVFVFVERNLGFEVSPSPAKNNPEFLKMSQE